MGLLHGGASAALSESIGSVAAVLLVEDVSQESVVGIELTASHLRSAREGLVTSVTRIIKEGRRIQIWSTEITDGDGRLLCVSRLTTMRIQL